MEVEAVRSSGATLTEALTAAERQMKAPAPRGATLSEETRSGFFARLLDHLRATPSWTEHPWQVGVNRRSMAVDATRWARRAGEATQENSALSRPESGKPVRADWSIPATPPPQIAPIQPPASAASQTGAAEPPVSPDTQTSGEQTKSFGYGLEEVLPPELLKESPLLQRTDPEPQAEAGPVSRRTEEAPVRPAQLLAARLYEEAGLLSAMLRHAGRIA